ncbi:flavodoxin domain-containing protein [Phytohabitans rumicis]|uniref:Flavodoxin domain-containing protein n=1 Tax=Phytohabitans rumicis TaxID=1076125 RepID=A0A6V8LKB6_9ACTN|nr:flavodoxin domain-containing protein [Phytohabitans rumicis]GFJ96654.1 hypothetical protein Prum_102960 [Phytohabitans rumicis]
MTVLVSYATTGGSTAEIAEWIAEELRVAGLAVAVRPAAEVDDLAGYDAVVLNFRNPDPVRAWARGVAADISDPA